MFKDPTFRQRRGRLIEGFPEVTAYQESHKFYEYAMRCRAKKRLYRRPNNRKILNDWS
jgi:hypothetical protein